MLQEIVSVAVQNVQYMENIIKEPNKNGTVHSNGNDPYKHFVSMTSFKMLLDLFHSFQSFFISVMKASWKKW